MTFQEIVPWARTQGTSSSHNIQPQDTVVPKKVLPLDIISCLFQLCMKFFHFFFKFSEEPCQVISIDLGVARHVKHLWLAAGADPGSFLGGGALVSCPTSTPINHIVFFSLQNTSCIRKPQVISGRGAHPLHPPPRSAPELLYYGYETRYNPLIFFDSCHDFRFSTTCRRMTLRENL